MKKSTKSSLYVYLSGMHAWMLRLVAISISAASFMVALVCGAVAMTPIKGPADSAFYSFSGAIAFAAMVLFMLAGSVVLQLRMMRILNELAASLRGYLELPKEAP